MDAKKCLSVLLALLCFYKTIALEPCPFSNDSRTIDLSNRMITSVTSDLFTLDYNCSDYFGETERLYLSSNAITSIDEDSFLNFYSLTHLDLSNNSISDIPNGTFTSSLGGVLEYLYLSYNNFTSLLAGRFNFYSLKVIHLDHNNISYVEPYVVDDANVNLQLFNMSYNSLMELEPWPYLVAYTNNSRLTRLFDLSNNQIANFNNSINWLYNLSYPYEVEMYLQTNNLEAITLEDLRKFKPDLEEKDSYALLLTFYMNITLNPFFCDCKLHTFANDIRGTFLRWSRVEEFRYRCATPTQYYGIDWLHDLPLYHFVCNVTDNCPNNCTCQERPHNDTMYVDCRGAGLTTFPEILPDTDRGKIELFLDNNFITSIKNTSYLHKVYNLSMSNNRLSSLDEGILRTMSNVSHLDFTNNRIRTLPRHIQTLNYDNVKLTGNPLFCDCDSFWLADWASLSISGSVTLTCDSDTGVHLVTEITQDNLNCVNEDLIVMGVLIGVAAVALLVIGLFVYKCPYETKVLLYKIFRIHPWNKYLHDEDVSMEIDIYLIFDHNPDVVGWVKKFIVDLKKKKPYYRILNPYRFTEPEAQEKVIRKWIAKSKRVLVVLSEGIFDNHWRLFEIAVAEDNLISAMTKNDFTNVDRNDSDDGNFDSVEKAAKIIYVKYTDDIEEKLEEETWKTRMSEKPVLKVNERMFMSKMRYELPPKGSGTKYDENIRIVGKRDDIQRLRNAKRNGRRYEVVNENERLSPQPGPSNQDRTGTPIAETMKMPLGFGTKPILKTIQGIVRPRSVKKVKRKDPVSNLITPPLQKDSTPESGGASVSVIQVHPTTSDDHSGIRLDGLDSRNDSRTHGVESVETDSTQSEISETVTETSYSNRQQSSTWDRILRLINPFDTQSTSSGYSSDHSRSFRRPSSSSHSSVTSVSVETDVMPSHSRHYSRTMRSADTITSQNTPNVRHHARAENSDRPPDSRKNQHSGERRRIETREIAGPNVMPSDSSRLPHHTGHRWNQP